VVKEPRNERGDGGSNFDFNSLFSLRSPCFVRFAGRCWGRRGLGSGKGINAGEATYLRPTGKADLRADSTILDAAGWDTPVLGIKSGGNVFLAGDGGESV